MHFIVEFRPVAGKEAAFRKELLRVAEATRQEPGCLMYRGYETIREPKVFAVYTEWVDEEAFELHARLPHTVRFLEAGKDLLTHEVKGLRLRQIV